MTPTTPTGLLIIDKPRGVSSHAVVQSVRHLFQTRKVGHAGTLDPEATGVMVLALGSATRLLEYYTDENKSYLADAELGKISTTGDAEGELTIFYDGDSWPTLEKVEQTLEQFRGAISQVPPIYSALKIDGERLYKKARRGETVDIPARDVFISQLEVTEYAPPRLQFHTTCSKGTYIRTLAEDIGIALGTGAYLTALRRTASGQFTLESAHTLEELEGRTLEERLELLLPLGYGLSLENAFELNPEQLIEVLHGRDIQLSAETDTTKNIFAWSNQQLVAILEHRAENIWKPRKVFTAPLDLLGK